MKRKRFGEKSGSAAGQRNRCRTCEKARFESRSAPTAAEVWRKIAARASAAEIPTLCASSHFTGTSFDTETTRAMCVAFEMVCRSLRLSDIADPLTRLIALKIVDAARAGELDAVRLHEAVMRWAASA